MVTGDGEMGYKGWINQQWVSGGGLHPTPKLPTPPPCYAACLGKTRVA